MQYANMNEEQFMNMDVDRRNRYINYIIERKKKENEALSPKK